ncbi:hypothetical protein ACFPIJ_42265 [Dactylosporangium cerinum]|uniref:Uncharacterized protein n=1 Tax=Dactylosporangium cerinum TaxID=1434730 RepID=A0ABV9W6X2_9ACTN
MTGPDPNRAATAELPAVLTRFTDWRASQFPVGVRVPLPSLPAHAGPPTAGVAVAPRSSRQQRRRTTQILAGVLAVLIVVTAVTIVRNSYGPPPRELVQRLFDAIADRDDEAFSLAGKCSDNPLCTAVALKTGYQPPTNIHIDSERELPADTQLPGTKRRNVTVSFDLNGRRATNEVGLTYRKQNFFGGSWSITEPPGSVITIPGPTHFLIDLAGADLPPIAADVPVTAWAPPGVYTVSKAGTALLEASQVTVTIGADGKDGAGDTNGPGGTDGGEASTTVTLPDTIKAGVAEQVIAQVRAGIDACAAQGSFNPDTDPTLGTINTCPMRHSTRYSITDKPQWTVLQYPQVRLDPAPDGTITVTTTTAGRAEIHYRWTMYLAEPRTWYEVNAVEEFKVNGRVTADNGTPTWAPT